MRTLPLLALDPSPISSDLQANKLLALFRVFNAAIALALNPSDRGEIISVLEENRRTLAPNDKLDPKDDAWLYRSHLSRVPVNAANWLIKSCTDRDIAYEKEDPLGPTVRESSEAQAIRIKLLKAQRLESRVTLDENPEYPLKLMSSPLWHGSTPKAFIDGWNTARAELILIHPSFDIWCDWYQRRLDGLPIDLELEKSVTLLSREIIAQGVVGTNSRVRQVFQRIARRPLNRVRAIFLGHGDAGKTSLVRALQGEQVSEGDQGMTRGLNISEQNKNSYPSDVSVTEGKFNDDGLKIHYWDFGGQVMVHHTHQFFLRSNCLYIIVIDGRRNERATDDARYWLEHVKAYGGDAPVMLVGNKIDLSPVQIDLFSLKRLFPNIVNFYPLCCTQINAAFVHEFRSFQRDFFLTLDGPVLTRKTLLTESEFGILERVRDWSADKPFMESSAFASLCKELNLEDEKSKLMDLFDKLGVIIHFPDIPFLDDILLNPEWLTRAVYEIMYSRALTEAQGQLTRTRAHEILRSANLRDHQGRSLQYTQRQCDFVLEAMRRFRLLFSIPEDPHTFIVPALLSAIQPQNDFDHQRSFAFRIRFEGFMPAHILPTLLVDRSQEIHNQEAWRFGGRFKSISFDAEAFVQADEHARTITISVSGKDANEYLGIFRDRMHQSLGRMQHLRFSEEVQLMPSMAIDGTSFQDPTWENYNQIRVAIKQSQPDRGPPPFVATNAQEYDLSIIREVLPRMSSKLRILVLAANPTSVSSLDLEEELRSLKRELESVKYRDDILFSAYVAARPDDLVRSVRSEKPSIVHFSGHGTRDGIVLRSEGGPSITEVSGQSLAQFFKGRNVKLVVLNACYSSDHAKAILTSVDAVVGTTKAVTDDAAIRFSVAFYRGLGNGLSVGEAFKDGTDAVILNGLDDVFSSAGNMDLVPLGRREI